VLGWWINVDNQLNAFDMHTSCRYVCGDQHLGSSSTESL
jgi:hypothetical protein